MKIKELKERIAKNLAEGRQIIDKADGEKRELIADEKTRWEACMADVRKDKDALGVLETQAALETEFRSPAAAPLKENPQGGGSVEEQEKRASAIHRSAFMKRIRFGREAELTAEESRALQVGPSAQGGFTVPVELSKNILLKLKDLVWIRQVATVLGMTQAESLGVPSLDTDPADADWTAEIATGSEDSSMAVGKRELRPHPLAKRIKISKKLLRSSVIDVEALVRDRIAYKFGVTEEKAFLLGSGAEQPLGLFVASANGISTGRDVSSGNSTTSIQDTGLQNAKFAVKGQYRKNAKWLFHRNALSQIAALKDGMGRFIFQPGLQLGTPDMLLGHPFMESEYAPSTFTTGLYVGLFGDFSYYWIVDSLAMELQPLFELYAEQNQVGFIARKETDGMPALEEAFARVKLA